VKPCPKKATWYVECEWRVCVSSTDALVIIIIIIKNECHSNSIVDKLQGYGHSKKTAGKVKVSHAAVKSFDRRGVSCKNARGIYARRYVNIAACFFLIIFIYHSR